MTQPSIFSMPEAFIKDQTVPARWRVLGVINGFLINGHACWASNEWIADKLGCHKDTVSQAVKELEDRGEITVTRGARSRTITRKIGGSAYHEGGSAPISDRQQRLSNSVSNASNINTALGAELVFEDEGERKKPSKAANAEYEEGLQWAEKRTGRKFINRTKQYAALKKAKQNDISIEQMVARWKEMEVNPFYQENGFDWTTVINSFDKKV